jgi:hypothetical protein
MSGNKNFINKYSFEINEDDNNIITNKREIIMKKDASVWKNNKIMLSDEIKGALMLNSAFWIYMMMKKKNALLAAPALITNCIIVSFGLTNIID